MFIEALVTQARFAQLTIRDLRTVFLIVPGVEGFTIQGVERSGVRDKLGVVSRKESLKSLLGIPANQV